MGKRREKKNVIVTFSHSPIAVVLAGVKYSKLYLTYIYFLRVVHAGGLLGWGLDAHGGDPDGAEGWPENEGGDGAAGGAWDRLHCGAHSVDGHKQRTARCAVSSRQVIPVA
jgi:hypothetical protein